MLFGPGYLNATFCGEKTFCNPAGPTPKLMRLPHIWLSQLESGRVGESMFDSSCFGRNAEYALGSGLRLFVVGLISYVPKMLRGAVGRLSRVAIT